MRLGLGLTLTEAPSFFHLFLRRSTEKKKETKSNENKAWEINLFPPYTGIVKIISQTGIVIVIFI